MLRILVSSSLFYLLLLFSVVLYWPGLHGGFLLDDTPNLLPLNALDSGIATWLDITLDNESGMLGRPVSMLTLVLNYLLNGNDPWNFKYTNLMIHLLAGVLVFWLSYRLLDETRLRDKRYSIALWVTAMWLLTPLQVSTVLYVIQRMTQLSALFVLAGLVSYTAGRQSLKQRPVTGTLLILASFLLWLPLAIFSKENGALLPLLALVIEAYFFKRPDIRWQRRFINTLFTITVLLPAVALLTYIITKPEFVTSGYSGRDFTLIERVYSEARIMIIYLRSVLIPDSTSMGLLHDDFDKSTGLLSPFTSLLSVLAWIMVPVLAWYYRQKTWSIYFFAPVFFIAAHVMESSIFALELYFEHRNYLASFGVYLMLAYALYSLKQRHNNHVLVSVFLLAFPAVHIISTYQRVQVWQSPISIILNDIHWHPKSYRAHGTIAGMYIQTGAYQKALHHLDITSRLNPRAKPDAYVLRLLALCSSGSEINDSEYDRLSKTLNNPNTYPPTESLRSLKDYIDNGRCNTLDLPRLIDLFDEWSTKQSNSVYSRKVWIVNVHLAQLMFDTDQDYYRHKALQTLERSMQLRPAYLEAGLLMIKYALILGKHDQAWETLQITRKNDNHHRKDFSQMIQRYEIVFESMQEQGLWAPADN